MKITFQLVSQDQFLSDYTKYEKFFSERTNSYYEDHIKAVRQVDLKSKKASEAAAIPDGYQFEALEGMAADWFEDSQSDCKEDELEITTQEIDSKRQEKESEAYQGILIEGLSRLIEEVQQWKTSRATKEFNLADKESFKVILFALTKLKSPKDINSQSVADILIQALSRSDKPATILRSVLRELEVQENPPISPLADRFIATFLPRSKASQQKTEDIKPIIPLPSLIEKQPSGKERRLEDTALYQSANAHFTLRCFCEAWKQHPVLMLLTFALIAGGLTSMVVYGFGIGSLPGGVTEHAVAAVKGVGAIGMSCIGLLSSFAGLFAALPATLAKTNLNKDKPLSLAPAPASLES